MPESFLPKAFAHDYEIDPRFGRSVAYFSMEFAIDQSFKIYSGGLGFLAGSHMRSAAAMRQNLAGIGIVWSYGYYHQTRGEEGEMAVQFRRNTYSFLEDTGVSFSIQIYGKPVWIKALYLPGNLFGTVPMFFLTTDIAENDESTRSLTHRLYDNDPQRRIAQYMILGIGGAKLFEELGVQPSLYHLNEAHGLSAAFRYYEKSRNKEDVRSRFVFTTHTPEEAGNEKTPIGSLADAGFFGTVGVDEVRSVTGIEGDTFNHSLAALRLSHQANAVSKLHGEVSRQMWSGYQDICPITHVTNAQNKAYWVDRGLEAARVAGNLEGLRARKRELKQQLFRIVADQTGKLMNPDTLTIVWARRFALYKRADLLARDMRMLRELLSSSERPVQILWAGKPYPMDFGAIDTFNYLVRLTREFPNAAVLTGYELELSRALKCGADVWLNTPIVTREASGTSGMSAAMNGTISISTLDGWICEFAQDWNAPQPEETINPHQNSFIVPPADLSLSAEDRDRYDMMGFYDLIHKQIRPLYYGEPQDWWSMVLRSMNDIVPFFDSDRMVAEYYEKVYA